MAPKYFILSYNGTSIGSGAAVVYWLCASVSVSVLVLRQLYC